MLNLLEKRVTRLEKSLYSESKQVGPLYHVCSLDNYLKWIKPNDTLQASGEYMNYLYGGRDYISFTRDQYFAVYTKSVLLANVLVQLVIDGDKLSNNYRIGPYNDFAYNHKSHSSNDIPKYREKEEVVKGPIKNLSKYLDEIRVDVIELYKKDIKKLKSSGLIERDALYFPFGDKHSKDKSLVKFIKDAGISLGEPLEYVMPVLEDFVNSSSRR